MNEHIFNLDNKIKIMKTDLVIFFVVFCTFEVSYFSFIALPIKLLYLVLQVFFIVWGLLNIFIKKKYEAIDFYLILFLLLEFYSTFLNHEDMKELLLNTKGLLLLYVSLKWAFGLKPRVYIHTAAVYSLILLVANTLSAIACYPRGLFYYDQFAPSFLMGADNTSTRTYILSLAICFIDIAFRNLGKRKRIINLYTIGLLNFIVYVVLRDIGNGKMCAIVFVLAYILFQVFHIQMPKKPMKKIVLGNYILFFIMVVFNRLDIFSFIIINILHRDLTVTTRTTIWKITMDKIASKPVLGNGYISGEKFESMLPSIIGINAHNTILMVTFIGGFTLSVVFALILFSFALKYDKKVLDNKLWMMPIAFLGMFLRSQVEGGDAAHLIAMVVLISSVLRYYKELNTAQNICVEVER